MLAVALAYLLDEKGKILSQDLAGQELPMLLAAPGTQPSSCLHPGPARRRSQSVSVALLMSRHKLRVLLSLLPPLPQDLPQGLHRLPQQCVEVMGCTRCGMFPLPPVQGSET